MPGTVIGTKTNPLQEQNPNMQDQNPNTQDHGS